MCHFSWGGLPLHANVPIMHLHAVQPPPSCSQDPVQRCLLNDALINFSVTSVFWADAVIADKRDLVFDCEGRWKQPDEEFRVHHQSQGYFRGRSEKRRMRWRGRGRRWNGDSEDKQILMSNDPFCLLSCMRKRREHKADLGKQPFWRWLFMAKMKRRTKHWFTQHICMVSRKFSLGTAPRLQLKRCLLPLLQWMCLRLSEWSEGTVGREIKGSAYGDSWLLTISCCDNDFFCLAYPSFRWLTYPRSVWLESSVPSLRQSRNTLIKLQYIQIKNWKKHVQSSELSDLMITLVQLLYIWEQVTSGVGQMEPWDCQVDGCSVSSSVAVVGSWVERLVACASDRDGSRELPFGGFLGKSPFVGNPQDSLEGTEICHQGEGHLDYLA